jgi:hypothetical protein
MRTRIRLTIVGVVVIAAACTGRERAPSADSAAKQVEDASAANRRQTASTPAGDSIGITSRSGEVLLSVAHDSVSMGFSPATLEKIRRETDTTGAGKGLGGMIERTVKSSVQSMLSTRIMVPVEDIESVRYEDGAIRFTYRTRPRGMTLENIKLDKEPALESFREDDARRFVRAVEARLQAR